MLRVIAEDDPTHLRIVPDGIYGPETTAAVSTFQRKHGLPVTGVTDHATWEAVVGEYTPALVRIDAAHPVDIIMNPGQVIRRGESNPHLYLAQAMLTVLADIYKSVAEPTHSGILDEPTADSLSSFQILCGHVDKMAQLFKFEIPQHGCSDPQIYSRNNPCQRPGNAGAQQTV